MHMTAPDRIQAIWAGLAHRAGHYARRPRLDFDAAFYAKADPLLARSGLSAEEHFRAHGMAEGRPRFRTELLAREQPELLSRLLDGLRPALTHPQLLACLSTPDRAGDSDAGQVPDRLADHLVLEFLMAGFPADFLGAGFSSEGYVRLYPDVAAIGLTPLEHYLLHGRAEGRLAAIPSRHAESLAASLPAAPLPGLWRELAEKSGWAELRPSPFFDPLHYLLHNSGLQNEGLNAADHFAQFGRAEGRLPCLSAHLRSHDPALWDRIAAALPAVITHRDLGSLLAKGHPGAAEFAFELLLLGDPVDLQISQFSGAFYLTRYPEIGQSSLPPLVHYVLHGRTEGRVSRPQAATDPDFLRLFPPMAVADHWFKVAAENGILAGRPTCFFDPASYARDNPRLFEIHVSPEAHFLAQGAEEQRPATRYQTLIRRDPELKAEIRAWLDANLHDRDLAKALAADLPGAQEQAVETILLGDPVDLRVSGFSARHYLGTNPEVASAGLPPFLHYLQHGRKERRRILADVLAGRHTGAQAPDPEKPNLLVCLHELSLTGAPVVARDMVRDAAADWNVTVLALRGGALLPELLALSSSVIISPAPEIEMDFLVDAPLAQSFPMAILISAFAAPHVPWLVRHDIPFAAWIHEYGDFVQPLSHALDIGHFADCIAFSSDHLRDHWRPLLADCAFDFERDSLVLAQHKLRFGQPEPAAIQSARARIGDLIGQHLGPERRLILGSGYAHWRKGTDLFAQTADMARDHDPSILFLWVGDGFDPHDFHFGSWMDIHLDYANHGKSPVERVLHHLPAGGHYRDALLAADGFFLPSRLDPLPNVVFDAAEAGCPIVVFDGASGFADPAYRDEPGLTFVPFGRTDRAAKALARLPLRATTTSRHTPMSPLTPDHAARPLNAARVLEHGLKRRPTKDRLSSFAAGTGLALAPPVARALGRNGRHVLWQSRAEANRAIAGQDHWLAKSLRTAAQVSQNPRVAEAAGMSPLYVHLHWSTTREPLRQLEKVHAALGLAEAIHISFEGDTAPDGVVEALETLTGRAIEVRFAETGTKAGRALRPLLELSDCIGPAAKQAIWMHWDLSQGDRGLWPPLALHLRSAMLQMCADPRALAGLLGQIGQGKAGLIAGLDPWRQGWGDRRSRALLAEWAPRMAPLLPGPLPDHPHFLPAPGPILLWGAVVARMFRLFGPGFAWPADAIYGGRSGAHPTEGTIFGMAAALWPAISAGEGCHALFLSALPEQQGPDAPEPSPDRRAPGADFHLASRMAGR